MIQEETKTTYKNNNTNIQNGEDLKINKLSIDTQDVIIEGNINTLTYSDKEEKKSGNIFGKIFK